MPAICNHLVFPGLDTACHFILSQVYQHTLRKTVPTTKGCNLFTRVAPRKNQKPDIFYATGTSLIPQKAIFRGGSGYTTLWHNLCFAYLQHIYVLRPDKRANLDVTAV
jgi:hypothetical protein